MVHQLRDYPRMERQDLSQSQLQAFKFSLVDDPGPESRHHSSTLPPLFRNQFAECEPRACPVDKPVEASSLRDDFKFPGGSLPSLDETYLGYGLPTIRPSLESVSVSPKKKFIQASAQRNMQANANAMLNGAMPYAIDSLSSFCHDEAFNGIVNGHTFDASSYGSGTSLIQALKNEQQAHYQSKLALEAEHAQRLEAETEVRKLVEHNKSLLNSIRLLQSTVKHMVKKDQVGETAHEKARTQNLHSWNKDAQATRVNNSILYDSLNQQRHQVEQQRLTELNDRSVSTVDHEIPRESANAKITEEGQLQKQSSRNFGTPTENISEHNFTGSGRDSEQVHPALTAGDIARHHLPRPTLADVPPQRVASNDLSRVEQSSSNPMLHLPASFLVKYCKPARRPPSCQSLSSDSDRTDVLAHRTNLTNQHGDKYGSVAHSRNMPGALHIEWKLRQDELDDFLNAPRNTYPNNKESWYFKHPLRYLPRITEKNVYRTVMIDFIPPGATYSDVLGQVRGGVLESVQMYGLGRSSTEFICARVVFAHEASAAELHERGQKPGIFIKGQNVRVWQVSEPTYPRSQLLEDLIYEEGYTRLLIVDGALTDMEQLLRRKLRNQIIGGFVLDISSTQDGMTLVEFTSIAEAEKALRLLIADPDLDKTQFDFEPDYCENPYDEV